jgi:hypothetical protein
MTSGPVQVERRVGQRFPFVLPISFRSPTTEIEGVGITQDLSSRGVSFLTDASLHEGAQIELTLTMPSEITLGQSMRVRCRGHILRTLKPADRTSKNPNDTLNGTPKQLSSPSAAETKIVVAVRFDCYEYLQDSTAVSPFPRVAVLHTHREEDSPDLTSPQRSP